MDWLQEWPLLVSGVAGYILGMTRDRLATIRAQQVDAIARLQEHVVEVTGKELFDGSNVKLTVALQGGTNSSTGVREEQSQYDSEVYAWHENLRKEEDKARLWINVLTVDMISVYVLIMSHCRTWERDGEGVLTEDPRFLDYMRCVFGGSTNRIINQVVITRVATGEPWCLNLIALSHLCLSAIQRRIRLEVKSPLRFRLVQFMEKLSGETERRSKWRAVSRE